MLELEKGKSPVRRAELYQPIAGHWQDFAKEVLPLSDLERVHCLSLCCKLSA